MVRGIGAPALLLVSTVIVALEGIGFTIVICARQKDRGRHEVTANSMVRKRYVSMWLRKGEVRWMRRTPVSTKMGRIAKLVCHRRYNYSAVAVVLGSKDTG
jgi:hypothetical protein